MTTNHPITPPPPHLLKKFSTQARDESNKRNGAGYLKTFAILCIEWAMNSQPTPNDRQIRSFDITPPPELVQQWLGTYFGTTVTGEVSGVELALATQAAQWGADQELEACCEWLDDYLLAPKSGQLRAARRPKPPSLKEQAYDALDTYVYGNPDPKDKETSYNIIRCALEALDD